MYVIDDLKILSISIADPLAAQAPARPRPESLLARLTKLAIDIFEAESEGPDFRSGGSYEAVIRDAASVVLDKGTERPTQIAEDPLDPTFRSLFDLMDDTVFEWPNVYDDNTQRGSSFADIWGSQ